MHAHQKSLHNQRAYEKDLQWIMDGYKNEFFFLLLACEKDLVASNETDYVFEGSKLVPPDGNKSQLLLQHERQTQRNRVPARRIFLQTQLFTDAKVFCYRSSSRILNVKLALSMLTEHVTFNIYGFRWHIAWTHAPWRYTLTVAWR